MVKSIALIYELVIGTSIVFYYWRWFAIGVSNTPSITIIQGLGLYMLVRLIVWSMNSDVIMFSIYDVEVAFPLFILGLGFLFSHLIGWVGLI